MKRTSRCVLGALCAGLLLLPAVPAWAQSNAKPPTQMTYQGFLTDGNGSPFGSTAPVNKTVIFRIYDSLTGGTLKWSSQQVVTVDKGYFSVLLGQGSAVGSEPFNADLTGVFTGAGASDRYLELNADGTTIAPRLRFLPAPSAMLAKSATELLDPSSGAAAVTVNSGNVTVAGLTASGTITAANLTASGTLSAASLSGSGANLTSLNASQITSGTMSAARLADLDASKITSGTLANARTTATSANTANAIVARDGSGNFSANIGTFGYANIGQVAQGFYSDNLNLALRPYPNGATFFQNSGGARTDMFIANNGNVGIGNTSPGSRLHVSGGDIQLSGGSFFMDNANIFYARNTSGSHEPFLWPRWADNIFYLNYGSGGFHIRNSGSATAMFMKDNGYVGIGTTTPVVKLDVRGSLQRSQNDFKNGGTDTGDYNNLGGQVNGTPAAGLPVTIRADSYIEMLGAVFYSDLRIKRPIGKVSSAEALDRVGQLKVTDYRMIDSVQSGREVKTGFIAQEVREVMPEAVHTRRDFLPDIYAHATAVEYSSTNKTRTVTMAKPHGLKTGDLVRLFDDKSQLELKVLGTPSSTNFVVGATNETSSVFVFGKQVDDFLAVDYDRIFTLGIAAIQELSHKQRELAEKLKAADARVAELEEKVANLSKVEAEMAAIKRQLSDLVAARADSGSAARLAGGSVRAEGR